MSMINALTNLLIMRGSPALIQSDNGTKYNAQALIDLIAVLVTRRLVSNQAALGRMVTVRVSTSGSAMNYSMEKSTTAFGKHRPEAER